MRYIKNGELQDERIITAIHLAEMEFKNGELIEARDRLEEVIAAIDEFTDAQSE